MTHIMLNLIWILLQISAKFAVGCTNVFLRKSRLKLRIFYGTEIPKRFCFRNIKTFQFDFFLNDMEQPAASQL